MRLFHNLNIDFMGKRTIFYFVSATVLLLGIIAILVRGIHFGIDFKGGSEVALDFAKPVDISYVRTEVDKLGLGNMEVKTFGGQTGILLRTELQEIPIEIMPEVKSRIENLIVTNFPGVQHSVKDTTSNSITYSFKDPRTSEAVGNRLFTAGFQTTLTGSDSTNTGVVVRLGVADIIKERLSEKFADNPFKLLKEDRVGPKVGKELKRNAVIAVILSLVAILIYLGFRFKFAFALGAVIALFHDVLLTLGIFVALYGLFPGLNLEFSITVLAAFLTLVGYSTNDTVIVFDRVREQMRIHKSLSIEENINHAINKTMSRTIITVFTVLISIVVLLIFGGEVLRGFAFALFIGMITGTYSSVFVASAFVLEYAHRSGSKLQF
ncbi:MAG: protein translocase subunit SecF [Bacteroidota bacterium]